MKSRPLQVRRQAKTTVLIVGEGDTEKAFLDYLKSQYVTRGCGVSVTTRNAHGKGPENVISVAIRHAKLADYTIVAVLMDTDLPWSLKLREQAKSKRVCLVGARPCCDGMLLRILGEPVPEKSSQCKNKLIERLGRKPVAVDAYLGSFVKERLNERRGAIESLDKLLLLMSGTRPDSD